MDLAGNLWEISPKPHVDEAITCVQTLCNDLKFTMDLVQQHVPKTSKFLRSAI